ncbi:hypothetical protein ACH5RR_028300 [Cinchona calisaya]|uniref:GAG-pre-integrase domain-containing protein n=1 Tax=Cinchona calisaya TaxID=153742 RepID=A0ABD2YS59_9GENT
MMSAQEAYVDKARKNETPDLWHARLGHVSYHKLKIMMMKSMLKGLPRALMDCVGCEKCCLWGKLQVLGLGTALKILFSVDGHSEANQFVKSVKFVHEVSPSIEKKIQGLLSEPLAQEISPRRRVWDVIGGSWCSTYLSAAGHRGLEKT